MSTGSVNSLTASYLQQITGNAPQGNGSKSTSAAQEASVGDDSQLSPLARLLATLQQLQQSDPAKYQQVTQQIATNLEKAAQSAQSAGNTTAAAQLSQLAADFTNASKTGQLPNVQDLAQAVGGGHHHHHHAHAASTDADSSTSVNGSSAPTSQTDSLDATNIILKTLTDAAVAVSST